VGYNTFNKGLLVVFNTFNDNYPSGSSLVVLLHKRSLKKKLLAENHHHVLSWLGRTNLWV
jgi:hypothetical protein